MNIKRKIAIAAVPAVMALASTSVDSKILLMSQEGWEVSFDGAANAFVMKNSVSDVPTDTNDGERLAGGFKTFGVVLLVTMIQVLLLVFYRMYGV